MHMQTKAHGAFCAITPEAREMVSRRMIMRDRARAVEARSAAAQWLAEHGTKPDRLEAGRLLSGRSHA